MVAAGADGHDIVNHSNVSAEPDVVVEVVAVTAAKTETRRYITSKRSADPSVICCEEIGSSGWRFDVLRGGVVVPAT